MKVVGLGWLGTRTEAYEELVRFYRDGMGLALDHSEPDFAIFRLPDGSRVEVFGPSDSEHRHFSTGPVAGFVVEDIDAARASSSGPAPRLSGRCTESLAGISGPTSGRPTAMSTRSPARRPFGGSESAAETVGS